MRTKAYLRTSMNVTYQNILFEQFSVYTTDLSSHRFCRYALDFRFLYLMYSLLVRSTYPLKYCAQLAGLANMIVYKWKFVLIVMMRQRQRHRRLRGVEESGQC